MHTTTQREARQHTNTQCLRTATHVLGLAPHDTRSCHRRFNKAQTIQDHDMCIFGGIDVHARRLWLSHHLDLDHSAGESS